MLVIIHSWAGYLSARCHVAWPGAAAAVYPLTCCKVMKSSSLMCESTFSSTGAMGSALLQKAGPNACQGCCHQARASLYQGQPKLRHSAWLYISFARRRAAWLAAPIISRPVSSTWQSFLRRPAIGGEHERWASKSAEQPTTSPPPAAFQSGTTEHTQSPQLPLLHAPHSMLCMQQAASPEAHASAGTYVLRMPKTLDSGTPAAHTSPCRARLPRLNRMRSAGTFVFWMSLPSGPIFQ